MGPTWKDCWSVGSSQQASGVQVREIGNPQILSNNNNSSNNANNDPVVWFQILNYIFSEIYLMYPFPFLLRVLIYILSHFTEQNQRGCLISQGTTATGSSQKPELIPTQGSGSL